MIKSNDALLATSDFGDYDTFDTLTKAYHRELLVHCYRILGSLQDAEDAVQDCLLRAWSRLDSLKDRHLLRAWLYKIATNVSLDMLDSRKAKLMPPSIYPPADPHDPLPDAIREPIWLEPLPDSYLDAVILNPEAHYEVKESLTLAFLTLLQQLPGRQRVILILRDVLGWKAQEVADLLDVSVVAVNSALQRARATLNKLQGDQPVQAINADDKLTSQLLARYVSAWEAANSGSLIALLREDAILSMPPVPAWFHGRVAIQGFLDALLFAGNAVSRFRLVATAANGSPAFVVHQAGDDRIYRPVALQVLTIRDHQVAQIDDFLALEPRRLADFNVAP